MQHAWTPQKEMHSLNAAPGGTRTLHESASSGDVGSIELCLNQGTDIHLRDEGGLTALHWAARGGHLEAVKWLLARGASKDELDNENQSAADLAATYGYSGVALIIMTHGLFPREQPRLAGA
jgi:ankyrin repeat protein